VLLLALLALLAVVVATAAAARERRSEPAPRATTPSRPAPTATPTTTPSPSPSPSPSPRRPRPAWRPDLAGPPAFAAALPGRPRAGLLVDLGSGRVLWRASPRRVLPVASLTKVMTALLVAESTRVGERALVTFEGVRARGSAVGGLPVGRRVGVSALLHGLLLASGNDAAAVLARHVAGSEPAFVARMNARARRLGLGCTRFATPHGIGPENRSCPADLARLARLALAPPRVARIVARRDAVVRLGGAPRTLVNTNPLLQARVPGVLGLKTGTSPSAGRCLIAVVRRGGRRLAAILLGSADPGGDARALLRRAG